MSFDFQSEIESLAQKARKDSLDSRVQEKPPPSKRRVSTMISIGVALVLIELGVFIFLRTTSPMTEAVPRTEVRTRFEGRNDCQAVAYGTYRAIVGYMRENGRPPGSLKALLGKELDQMPVDPATGKPLQYATDGQGFSLDCPQ